MQVNNGIPAYQLACAAGAKVASATPPEAVSTSPSCPAGAIAVRNSRYPSGPALIYTRREVGAFLAWVKDGEFDDLRPGGAAGHYSHSAENGVPAETVTR